MSELARETGASEEAVLEALEAGQGYRAASIDVPDGEDEALATRLGERDRAFDVVEDRQLLGPAVAALPSASRPSCACASWRAARSPRSPPSWA